MNTWSFIIILFVTSIAVCAQTTCGNIDFESTSAGSYTSANAVNGWSVSSQINTGSCQNNTVWTPGSPEFSIMTTPFIEPTIGIINHSPLGGQQIARLNYRSTNSVATRLSKTFTVSSSESLLTYAMAFDVLRGSSHSGLCCARQRIEFNIKDCMGNILPTCGSFTLCPDPCFPINSLSYSNSPASDWANWIVRTVDLHAQIGNCVTIEFVAVKCANADHIATLFLDVFCPTAPDANINFANNEGFTYCQNNSATLYGPSGASGYTWTSPGVMYFYFNPTIIFLPATNSVQTLVTRRDECIYTSVYKLTPTTLSLAAITCTPSCPEGSSGMAAVLAKGSTSYSYTWKNPNNTVVSTSSLATNLSPGVYSVLVSSPCGSVVATATIASVKNFSLLSQPVCTISAYVKAPAGNNYQWYYNNYVLSGPMATSQSFTWNTFYNGPIPDVLTVGYNNTNNGCRDSIRYILPQKLTTLSRQVTNACEQATGSATIAFSYETVGLGKSLTVVRTGTTSPFLLTDSTNNIHYSIPNLSAGIYSVTAFDGLCLVSNTFQILQNNMAINLPASTTLYSGASVTTSIFGNFNFLTTFTWTPSPWISSGLNSYSIALTGTLAPGSMTTSVLQVKSFSMQNSCLGTRTIAVTIANPLTPTILPVPLLCENGPTVSVNVNPAGGNFINQPGYHIPPVNGTGVITPSNAIPGIHSFTYSNSFHSCIARNYATYTVHAKPAINIQGPALVCSSRQITLTASGAQTYTWSDQQYGNAWINTLNSTRTIQVTGTDFIGCSFSATTKIDVTPTPTLSASPSTIICLPGNLLLYANGAQLYRWNTGDSIAMINTSALSTTIYSVIGINTPGECADSAFIKVETYHAPAFDVTGDTQVCSGQTAILTASGAAGYDWNGVPASASIAVSPPFTSVFQVTGIDISGNCRVTKNIVVNVEECASIKTIEKTNFNIYPNPASDILYIETAEKSIIKIYDITGKLLLSKDVNAHTEIEISWLKNGMYLLHYESQHSERTIKLVKI